jgi:hypothetical protein
MCTNQGFLLDYIVRQATAADHTLTWLFLLYIMNCRLINHAVKHNPTDSALHPTVIQFYNHLLLMRCLSTTF